MFGSAQLTVEPPLLDFGDVTQGFASRAALRISNAGTALLDKPLVAWVSGSDPDLAVIHNRCNDDLEPGESCDLVLQVVPSRVGAVQGTLALATGMGDVAVPAAARGLLQGPLMIQPAAGSFEDLGGVRVGGSVESTFVVTNVGPAASGPLTYTVGATSCTNFGFIPETRLCF